MVPPSEPLRRALVELNHDSTTAGHPGIDKTYYALLKQYWWPGCRTFVREYVKGCAICQANKPITHRNNPPIDPITATKGALPFETIAVDFIVKLPLSEGYDSIMTITDHDCTKAVILIPCHETIDTEGVAKLFKDRVFPFTGLPKKIISDRDTRFTSSFFKEICSQLGIVQNLSSAYHPQTDGQSEKTNQHTETGLRIFCNYQQDDWAHYIPMIQYAINARPSATTKQTPYELWMGFTPRAHQPNRTSKVPTIELRKEQMTAARKQAEEAMTRAQELLGRKSNHTPYQKDQWVWLEGKHLQTTHPSTKMRPKRFGPFRIMDTVGKTTYKLDLPSHWKIHNAFHANLLLPYQETKEHGRNFTDPPPELVEGQEEWEVEQILDSRLYRRKRQYLIKWKGYSEAHNSWEPEENIRAPDLILAFQKRTEDKDRHPRKKAKLKIVKLRPRNAMWMREKPSVASKDRSLRPRNTWVKDDPLKTPRETKLTIRTLRLIQGESAGSSEATLPSNHNTPSTPPNHHPHSSTEAEDQHLANQRISARFSLCQVPRS